MCQTSAARSWRRSVTRNKNRTPVMIRLRLQMLAPLSMRCSWKRRTSSGVAVSGERFSQPILADATNLGLTRMAAASQGVTRDQLIWIADAYIRPETYKAALARIINAHHALPIAAMWGDGTTSSSDGQFFRSAKRGDAAGEINARYGHDPGSSF